MKYLLVFFLLISGCNEQVVKELQPMPKPTPKFEQPQPQQQTKKKKKIIMGVINDNIQVFKYVEDKE
jgi:hypothetical protein